MSVLRRVAVAGSATGWPAGEAWDRLVTDELWHQVTRLPADAILVFRHGNADLGPDNITHRWVQSVLAGAPNIRPDVQVREEVVDAAWENCNPHCKPVKADGEPHRRPNPGYPAAPRRGSLPDYCPSAGHWRNPEVVGYRYDGPPNRHERKHYHPLPDVRVNLLLAWIINNSPGTSATVRHAAAMRVPHVVHGAYV